ncbi:TPA: hypothetical protein ACHJX8_004453 [Yersinia enterocolitica]|uniref:hypothetical protein n=1 Tax=Yersinia massiliensis TaxID=419257 RepID=UPI001562B912|nr:hypothetical protein [Yersinia massiliensis]QKJ09286.1 hypothetical protein HRD68_00230 [Yersinia massiliensis]HDX9051776.1 hypothetical protein [Yersinia enterocolitica]
MADLDFTHLHGLTQMKMLFPELTEKQFRLTYYWFRGGDLVDIANLTDCSVAAVKKTLQRSRQALGCDRLETVRLIFLARIETAHFMQISTILDMLNRSNLFR